MQLLNTGIDNVLKPYFFKRKNKQVYLKARFHSVMILFYFFCAKQAALILIMLFFLRILYNALPNSPECFGQIIQLPTEADPCMPSCSMLYVLDGLP